MPLETIERIRAGDTPFGGHPILNGDLGAKLAAEEHARAIAAFHEAARGGRLEALDVSDLWDVQKEIVRLLEFIWSREKTHGPELRRLALETVAELHGLEPTFLSDLVAEVNLYAPGELGNVGDDAPLAPANPAAGDIQGLVAKRRTHNAIIQGVALCHFTQGIVFARPEIERLSPGLFRNYALYANLGMIIQFLAPLTHTGACRQGASSVAWTSRGPRITARADNFAVLCQEISKGLLEIQMAHGLPRPGELNPHQEATFRLLCENELFEPLYFMMGPALARRLDRALFEGGITIQRGESPHPLKARAYTRTLMSQLSEGELHGALPGLLFDGSSLRNASILDLHRFLREAERRATCRRCG